MLIRRFIELLTPQQCLGCGEDFDVLCDHCLTKSSLSKPEVCFRCGRKSAGGATCEGCSRHSLVSRVSVGAYYDGAVKELVWKLKFFRLRGAVEMAGKLVLAALPGQVEADVVTAVPISPQRYRERGYNQSELLAKYVAARLGLPYASLLGRENSAHQVGNDRARRLEQIRGAFYATRQLRGARVLVVDDVVTTGATLEECAATLVAAGAGAVRGAVVARH